MAQCWQRFKCMGKLGTEILFQTNDISVLLTDKTKKNNMKQLRGVLSIKIA
jgi:hypothetical protein